MTYSFSVQPGASHDIPTPDLTGTTSIRLEVENGPTVTGITAGDGKVNVPFGGETYSGHYILFGTKAGLERVLQYGEIEIIDAEPEPVDTLLGAKVDALYASQSDTLSQRRLSDLASVERTKTLAAGQIAYTDASAFTESWANLTAWSSGTFGQVSSNRLFSNNQGGASGANHSFAIPAAGTFRALFHLRTVSGLTSGGLAIGVSKDAAGAAATAGATASRALYFRADIAKMDLGTATTLSGNQGGIGGVPTGTTDWIVTVTGTATYLSIVARSTDGTKEARVRWARDHAAFPINNLYVFNSDSRMLTGHSIGLISARGDIRATNTVRAGAEDVSNTVVWNTVNGAGVRIAYPLTYDSRKPSPVALCFHGNGSDETLYQDNTNGQAVANGLLAAGYIVVSASYAAATSTWGNQNGLDAMLTAYRLVRDTSTIGPVVVYGNSMGGIEALLTLAERRIPGIVAAVYTNPTYNLAENRANAIFTSTIDSAYGGNYAVNAVGHDPALMNAAVFRGLPTWILVASDDAAVTPAANGDALATALTPYGTVTKVTTTGGHSTSFSPHVATITAWFNTYAAA